MNRYWKTALDLDRRMGEADIPYCVIKTFRANPDYNDSNIDVVCPLPLAEVHQRVYPDYTLSLRDWTKAVFYERNKRMVKHPTGETSDIHLHTNAGWHDVEFVSGKEILAGRQRHELSGGAVWILEPELDARILTLQILFENFRKKRWDLTILGDPDLTDFAATYGVTEGEIQPVREAAQDEPLPRSVLAPIWRKYYARRRLETHITPWNRFLHELLFALQAWRMERARR